MSKIHRLPDPAAVELEASAWVARMHADDVTVEDMMAFEAWRTAHARHAKAYDAMCNTVAELKCAGRIARAVSFGNAMNAAADSGVANGAGGRTTPRMFRLGIAAAMAVLALTVTLLWWGTGERSQTLFQTGIGEHASVQLPDGSLLELNSDSVARVLYTDQARTIRLVRGEAFFQVAHQPQRPFWVVAGESWVRAVGTAFNVRLRPSGVRVTVSEGTVKLARTGRTRASGDAPSDALLALVPVSLIAAGQQAEVQADTARIRTVGPLEVKRLAAWRNGTLYFENEHLESVVEEVGRYTTYRIVIEDAALRRLPVGGTFQANSHGVDTLLSMLEQGFGLRIRREDGERIYVENAAPPER